MKKLLTLCMVVQDDKVLLGMKKRGFGEGLWNGFGGKVDQGETIEQAAVRELREETGVEATHMQKIGILEFSFEGDPKVLEVHIFRVDHYTGEPAETEEMRPEWFAFDDIPFAHMWPNDEYWYPYMRAGKLFRGSFLFDIPSTTESSAKILSKELYEVESL